MVKTFFFFVFSHTLDRVGNMGSLERRDTGSQDYSSKLNDVQSAVESLTHSVNHLASKQQVQKKHSTNGNSSMRTRCSEVPLHFPPLPTFFFGGVGGSCVLSLGLVGVRFKVRFSTGGKVRVSLGGLFMVMVRVRFWLNLIPPLPLLTNPRRQNHFQ